MSKKDELVDQYLELCDETDEEPELDADGNPDPYCKHARTLRKLAKREVARVEPEQQARGLAGLRPEQAQMANALIGAVGKSIGRAIGEQLAPLREELTGLRQEMREGRQTQEGIRKQMQANRPQGAALTDDEWEEHEQAYQQMRNGGNPPAADGDDRYKV